MGGDAGIALVEPGRRKNTGWKSLRSKGMGDKSPQVSPMTTSTTPGHLGLALLSPMRPRPWSPSIHSEHPISPIMRSYRLSFHRRLT